MEETEDFDRFYAAAFARLVGQLVLVTGDRHEAEDVVQEAMARAASRWARLRAYEAPEAWVRRVAFNLAVSGHRRARRRLAALLRLGPPAPVPPVSVDALALADALQGLTVAHRQVVSCTTWPTCQATKSPPSCGCRWARSRPGWPGPGVRWPPGWPTSPERHLSVNDLRDRLQELADGYARTSRPPGPAAARRRGRWRRRRTVGGLVLAGLLVIAAGVGLLPALQMPGPVAPPATPAPVQVPRSTAWFQASYMPGGLRLVSQRERPAIRYGPFRRVAQSFRLVKGDGEFTVSVHPDLQRLDVAREIRTYPTVRVVPVRGHQGLLFLFPRRPDNFYTGLIWEERPGLVMQVLGSQGVADQLLLDVAAGLRIAGTPAAKAAITVGPRPPGWIRVGHGTNWPAIAENLMVLPRSHHQLFDQGRRGRTAELLIIETRGQFGPLRSADRPKNVPVTRREAVTVHGYPALLDHDPINHFLEVTWREPGGTELTVHAKEDLGRRQLLAIAEGLRQP